MTPDRAGVNDLEEGRAPATVATPDPLMGKPPLAGLMRSRKFSDRRSLH